MNEFFKYLKTNQIDKCTQLLREGNINVNCEDGNAALIKASINGQIEMVRLLLKYNVNQEIKDIALLQTSRCSSNLKIVQLLIEFGADVNYKNRNKETALIWASFKDRLEISLMLLQKGSDVNHEDKWGDTALLCATNHNNLKIVQLLMKFNANVNHVNRYGITIFDVIFESNNLKIGQLLPKFGALMKGYTLFLYHIEFKRRRLISIKINSRFYQIIKIILFYL